MVLIKVCSYSIRIFTHCGSWIAVASTWSRQKSASQLRIHCERKQRVTKGNRIFHFLSPCAETPLSFRPQEAQQHLQMNPPRHRVQPASSVSPVAARKRGGTLIPRVSFASSVSLIEKMKDNTITPQDIFCRQKKTRITEYLPTRFPFASKK